MSRSVLAAVVAVVGLALGYSYGRWMSPVEYVDVEPSLLRVDFRTDYVLMLAERYEADHDLQTALRRLALLGDVAPDRACAEAIQFAQSAHYSGGDVNLLQQLLRAVQEQMVVQTPQAGTQ